MPNQLTKIERFLDDGKVAVWPSKTNFRQAIRQYLAKKHQTEKVLLRKRNKPFTKPEPYF